MDLEYFMQNSMILKNIPRTGWLQRGVPSCEAESIAEHTFHVVSILATVGLTTNTGLDIGKMLIMGEIHDLGEAISGDIPMSLTVRFGHGSKIEIDNSIMDELTKNSGIKGLSVIFKEYQERKTQEALLVKIADLIATMKQAKAYSEKGYKVNDILEGCCREISILFKRLKPSAARDMIKKLC